MAKKALILNNIGTPDSPAPQDVARYLKEFLMDQDVIQLPYLFRTILVNGIIVPRRKHASGEKYKKIWGKDGSPLLAHTYLLQEKLKRLLGEDWMVEIGMRYGSPSLDSALTKIQSQNIKQVFLFPLYPQYAQASTGSSLRWMRESSAKKSMSALSPFYAEDFFIQSWTDKIQGLGADEKLILSYHGLPLSQIQQTPGCLKAENCCQAAKSCEQNCYRAQCYFTSEKIREKLGLSPNQIITSFQSRLGLKKWLTPSTESVVRDLALQGTRKVKIACPSFVTDCLETLEEVGLGLREVFQKNGGRDFQLISCPNANDIWAQGLSDYIQSESLKQIKPTAE